MQLVFLKRGMGELLQKKGDVLAFCQLLCVFPQGRRPDPDHGFRVRRRNETALKIAVLPILQPQQVLPDPLRHHILPLIFPVKHFIIHRSRPQGKEGFPGETISSEVGTVNVTLDSSSVWTLTADTDISSFTGDAANVVANGHTLYVNGVALSGTK